MAGGSPPTRRDLVKALERVVTVFPPVGQIHTPEGSLDLDELRELLAACRDDRRVET